MGDWFQSIASAAVIVGLVLVIIELRQTKSLVQAQLLSEGFAKTASLDMTIAGENPGAVLAKACDGSKSLTVHDTIILDHLYWSAFGEIARAKQINAIADLGTPWESYADFLTGLINTPYGHWWWSQSKTDQDPEIVQVVDAIMANADPSACRDYHTRFAELKP